MATDARHLGPGAALALVDAERLIEDLRSRLSNERQANADLQHANEQLLADNAALMAENLRLREALDGSGERD